ncbi:MAG: hypothetical protein ABIJ09_01710 [Pseudomonadota bacterium]
MLRSILGWLLLAIGLVGFAVECDHLISGTGDGPVLGFVLAGIFAAGGTALLGSIRRRKRLRQEPSALAVPTAESLEPAIFRLARDRSGRISAGEVSAEFSVSFDLAHQALERLALREACQVMVNEAGATLYRFAEFEGVDGKRDLLE